LHRLSEFDDRFMFDSIAYQSPLRGLTILKDVFVLQHDDLTNPVGVAKFKCLLPLKLDGLTLFPPDRAVYEKFSYKELLRLYIDRLNSRSRILANTYSKVHIQLTGGADSRLALSSFLKFKNICCYVYGDGASQNRLIFNALTRFYGIEMASEIIFCGASLNSPSLLIKGLVDTNFRKLNNLDTYMNSNDFSFPNECKVTGYYGANVAGGVPGPPVDTTKNPRTSFIPSHHFDYHEYVDFMRGKYHGLRSAAFDDVFYINNRGQSHYAAHSIADNLKCNSFDVLYDPINLELVRKCPYTDIEIARNAISVDLICFNDAQLALFPYDSRSIPRFRNFENVPIINCFDGLNFREDLKIHAIPAARPIVESSQYNVLAKGTSYVPSDAMLNYGEFDHIFNKYDFLNSLRLNFDVNSGILLNYLLGRTALQRIV
jgi:hypothetical protein